MRKPFIHIVFISFFSAIVFLSACSQQENKFTSPAGYNLNDPEKFIMPAILHEISGIAFLNGNSDTLYAEQDEEGKIFYLRPGDKKAAHTKFGKNGDYEDIAICNNYIIMLRSDGTLYTFSFSEVGKPEAGNVKEFQNLIPNGEYEGLYADNATNHLFVLCKNCNRVDASKSGVGYVLQLAADGTVTAASDFRFNVKDIEKLAGDKKIIFHPSALALNPAINEWYILSSVNKLLIIADKNWNIKQVYHLDPSKYIQPEGIAFDKDANLYISNEGGETQSGIVLKIKYDANKK